MTMTATSVAPAGASIVLWRIWFDDGLAAIERGDFLQAIPWLVEALRYTSSGSDDDLRNAMTQAHLAWALSKQAEAYCRDVKLSAEALAAIAPGCEPHCPICSPCCCDEDSPKLAPAVAETRAGEFRAQAWGLAQNAAPRLKFDRQQPQLNLATARATQLVGEANVVKGDMAEAARFFELALTYYIPHLPAQIAATDAVLASLFLVRFRQGRFDNALAAAIRLENRVAPRPHQEAWTARLLTCQAETLLRQGEYRSAVSLYARWKGLHLQGERGPDFAVDAARGGAIFAKALILTGDLDEAFRAVSVGRDVLECVPVEDPTILFDLAAAQAEISLQRGELLPAQQALDSVGDLPPSDTVRLLRYRLTMARLALARGDYSEARSRYTESLAIAETLAEPRLIGVVPSLVGLARVDSLQGDWKTACVNARCAIDRLESERGRLRPELALALHELAVGFQHDNGLEESGALVEKALELLTTLSGASHPEAINMHLTAAVYEIAQRRPREALESCRSAQTLQRKFAPCDGFGLARVWGAEALADHTHGDLCSAHCKYEAALERWSEAEVCLGKVHPEKSLLMLTLAALLLAAGNELTAFETYIALLPLLDELKCHHPGRMAYEINRWANLFKKTYRFTEAMWLYSQSAALYAQAYGSNHPYTLLVLDNSMRTLADAEMLGRPIIMPSAQSEPALPAMPPPPPWKIGPSKESAPRMTRDEASSRIQKILPRVPKSEVNDSDESPAKPATGPRFPVQPPDIP